MSLFRVVGRSCLNINSDSPVVKSSYQLHTPNLDASPFVYRRSVGYVGNPPHLLGSPSYPTPLDDVRVGHNYSNVDNKQPLRQNLCGTPRSQLKETLAFKSQENGLQILARSPLRSKRRLLDPIYSPVLVKGGPPMVQEESWRLKGDKGTRPHPRSIIDPSLILNPNKAVLTLDASGKILTVNDMTTLLLGEDLIRDGTSLLDLLPCPSDVATVQANLNRTRRCEKESPLVASSPSNMEEGARLEVAAEEDIVEATGVVVFSGNVVNIRTDGMGETPVSLWMKELPTENEEDARWIAVIEPITMTVTKVTVNKSGLILNTDKNFLVIFGFEAVLDNDNLFHFISSMKMPDSKTEEWMDQPCTGCTKEGETFPLSVSTTAVRKNSASVPFSKEEESSTPLYDVKIKLFSNISGLVIVDENAVVLQYNHNFTRLLFGYGSKELEGQSISRILPEFQKMSCCGHVTNKNLFGPDFTKNDNNTTRSVGRSCDNFAFKETSIPYVSNDDSSKENTRHIAAEHPGNEKDNRLLEGSNYATNDYMNDRNANVESSSSIYSPNKGFIVSDNSQFTFSSGHLPSRNSTQKSSSVSATSNPSNQANPKGAMESLGSPIQSGTVTPVHVMRDITNSMNMFSMSECLDQTRFPPNLSLLTSTPAVHAFKESLTIREGSYFSVGKHKDGSTISILYQIRRLCLGGRDQFCLWITWEPADSSVNESKNRLLSSSSGSPADCSMGSVIVKETLEKSQNSVPPPPVATQGHSNATSLSGEEDDEETSRSMTHTDGSSCNDYSLAHSFSYIKQRSFSENDVFGRGRDGGKYTNSTTFEEPEWILTSGDYSTQYSVLRQIGKGAFGYVKMSYKNSDGLIVITKFIKKSQVYKDSWTLDPTTGKKLCLEVDLLLKLDHPNIVKALEYFENEKYFQLVMEKWGSGMDLFEFIDRNPALDEPLISYIFRQIVSPLIYLRSLNIIHRDIKDENIIINQTFHIKLIDFGSATYLEPNKKFSQFAGTIEYCSPEVLKGHRYSGPELEIWSLGITLYTLVFGENPFSTVEQVLKDPLVMPISYSDDLFALLDGMLKKSPKERMSLEDVSSHCWTNQQVDLDAYSFEDIVPCENDELSPPQYVFDYGLSEESLSTASNSFVYEERQSHSATESSFFRQSKYGTTFLAQGNDEDDITANSNTSEGTKVTANSSRTSTHSASSLKSSITIDSSVFFVSPENKMRKKTRSSLSDCSDATTSEASSRTPSNASSRHKRSTKKSSDSLFSFASHSSNSNVSSRSSSSTSSTSCNVSDISNSCSDDKNSTSGDTTTTSSSSSSTSASTSTSSSRIGSQETVSIDSSSEEDDNTLANTFTNVLILEKKDKDLENGDFE